MVLQLSKDAINKAIMAFEVSWSPATGFATYNRKYRKPVVPDPVNTNSGVTIGMGYDCGQYSAAKIKLDWQSVLPLNMVNALAATAGLTKQNAVNALAGLRNIVDVPVEAALQVFYNTTIFEFARKAAAIYPELFRLHPVEQSVIVGLVYNRGNSLKDNDRRREMRQLVNAIQLHDENAIANLILSMQRLWPDTPGLRTRRRAEAALVRLPNTGAVNPADLLKINIA